jgi:hypothetical protein
MLLTYFLNDFEMVPVAPIITGITLVYYYYYYYYFHGASAHFRDMATPITEPKSNSFKMYGKVNVQAAYIAILWEGEMKASACWTSTIRTSGQLQDPVKRCQFKDCLISGTAETPISGEGNTFISGLQFLFAFR